jgi:WD40 repeat protein
VSVNFWTFATLEMGEPERSGLGGAGWSLQRGSVESDSMLALGQAGGHVKLVSAATGEVKWTVPAHVGPIHTDVTFRGDGRFVVSAGFSERQWKSWDCSNGQLEMARPEHTGNGSCTCGGDTLFQDVCPLQPTECLLTVEFSPCDRWLASAGNGGLVGLWDMPHGGGNFVETLAKQVTAVSFSGDSKFLACSGGWDNTYILDVELGANGLPGAVLKSLHTTGVGRFCPTNSNWLAVNSLDYLGLWDIATDTALWKNNWGDFGDANNLENFAIFSPDGLRIASINLFESAEVASSDDDGDWEYPQNLVVVDAATGIHNTLLVGDLPNTEVMFQDAVFSVKPKP